MATYANSALARLRAALERAVEVGGERLDLRASVGAACYPDDGEDAEALLRRAEAALLR